MPNNTNPEEKQAIDLGDMPGAVAKEAADRLGQMAGVKSAVLDAKGHRMLVVYDSNTTTLEEVVAVIDEARTN